LSPSALQFVLAALQLIPSILGDVASVKALIAEVQAVISGGTDPTAAQWAALNTQMARALAALQAAGAGAGGEPA